MKTVIQNAAKLQCRKLAWMREPEWKWHIVHTDHMSVLLPKFYWKFNEWFGTYSMSFGYCGNDNAPNGPND